MASLECANSKQQQIQVLTSARRFHVVSPNHCPPKNKGFVTSECEMLPKWDLLQFVPELWGFEEGVVPKQVVVDLICCTGFNVHSDNALGMYQALQRGVKIPFCYTY